MRDQKKVRRDRLCGSKGRSAPRAVAAPSAGRLPGPLRLPGQGRCGSQGRRLRLTGTQERLPGPSEWLVGSPGAALWAASSASLPCGNHSCSGATVCSHRTKKNPKKRDNYNEQRARCHEWSFESATCRPKSTGSLSIEEAQTWKLHLSHRHGVASKCKLNARNCAYQDEFKLA